VTEMIQTNDLITN